MATSKQQAVSTDRAAPPAGPYNQAVRWGDLVFTASVGSSRPGEQPPDARDVRAHTANALENLKAILEAAGSSLDNVVKVSAYLRDMGDYQAMNEVYRQYFTGVLPARTLVVVPGSPSLIGFDAIGFVAGG
jgi:2-iminobutanoate/2-iminopropanoate deaminase